MSVTDVGHDHKTCCMSGELQKDAIVLQLIVSKVFETNFKNINKLLSLADLKFVMCTN